MTDATQTRPASAPQTALQLAYSIEMSNPESHLFEVTFQISNWQNGVLDLKMPVWTPGSYLVREYARHLQNFAIAGRPPHTWQKLSKNHWQVQTGGMTALTVSYRIFANELTVRTNHLDSTHGFFNPAALCLYIPGYESHPIQITVTPPHEDWRVTTPLPAVPGLKNTFLAQNFDELVDSPFEIGRHRLYEFTAAGKPHQLAIWGQGNEEPERMVADMARIIETEANLFGGVPYDRYLFLLHLSAQGYGGLEHKNACTLNYPRFGLRATDKYHRYMQLVAHEFFHLWNVKRIRPKALEVFDYDGENYTPSLWFSEGVTSYYDLVLPFRAGIYDAKTLLKALGKEITRYLTIPGRHVQPLSESSFDAWIKLYRRDANSDNSQMSYYLKGAMVSLMLDLLIRARHSNQRSLDDVMRRMWQQFGQPEIGFTPEQLAAVIAGVADTDLTQFFQQYLHTTVDLPLNQYLQPFGLRLEPEDTSDRPPFTGITVKQEHGQTLVKFVEARSPGQKAGIDPGDEVLAIDGVRVTAEKWSDRLKDYAPGDAITVTVFHQDELRTCHLTLAAARPTSYQLVPVDCPTPEQIALGQGWLGVELSSLQ
jgi:predicted metalloprotease with PDZ domain